MSGFLTALIAFCVASIITGTTLLYGTLGEILTEKAGNLNLGVEGMMLMGGIGGMAGVYYLEKAFPSVSGIVIFFFGMICAFLVAAFGALIFSILSITLRANQIVTGLALTIFGTGFGQFFGEHMRIAENGRIVAGITGKSAFQYNPLSGLENIPVVGQLLFSYNTMVYIAIIIALLMSWFFYHTHKGLNLRAVGENPATADAAGINVNRYKYLATCIGGGICGLGGLYFVMVVSSGVWTHEGLLGKGWLAVALVIFVLWSPNKAIAGSLLFGALSIMFMRVTIIPIPTEIYKILPYIATVIVLIISSMRNKRENQPPGWLGLPYFREDR